MAKRSPKAAPDSGVQGALFGEIELRSLNEPAPKRKAPAADGDKPPRWRMADPEGVTVAELRLRWNRRLTPAQVARIESELAAIPRLLGKLGFGPVLTEHSFVRRRRK